MKNDFIVITSSLKSFVLPTHYLLDNLFLGDFHWLDVQILT